MRRRSLQLIIVVGAVAVAACAFHESVVGENGAECVISSPMDSRDLLRSCGLPNGLQDQPKIAGGGWFSFELCSAPAYIYSQHAVLFGCDGKVAEVVELEPNTYQGFLPSPTKSLLEDIKYGGPHLAARIVQLQHQDFMSDVEIRGLQQVLRDAAVSDDPFVKRAELRIRGRIVREDRRPPRF